VIEAAGWSIVITDQLRAHFNQPGGPSRPGADWAVTLAKDGQTRRILVRAWDSDVGDQAPQRAGPLVEAFVSRLLEGGWTPDAYGGAPGELVYAGPKAKPWWRMW
jgi:hypothetical protein